MRRVEIDHLTPGMVVGRSIYSSQGHVLLKEQCVLTPHYIERLKSLSIPCLYVQEDKLRLPPLRDVISEDIRINTMVRVRSLLDEAGSAGVVLKTNKLFQLVTGLVEELLQNRNTVVNFADIRLEDDYLFSHSVNVCLLALLTGISLSYSKGRLCNLGLGAMLHDVGKTQLPRRILDKPDSLTPEEYELVKAHSAHGYKMLINFPFARDMAYQHHERLDGSGYPRSLKGKEVSEESQITAIADVFDALISNRQYRAGFPPHEAYEFLAAIGNVHFDIALVRAFLSNVAAYPTGVMVELSDGRIALALETPHGQPLLPRVRCLFDQELRYIAVPLELCLGETALHVRKVIPPDVANRLLSQV
ncbi:MAG: HD-GYP domain-containing protein [Peptococcaceae bacterium]|nr:HD-GYP domain-containing protein [Peptococcaceae bacterium]